ncbi:tRNA(adenine(34)) deaminase [Bertholletia excelsa]
MYNTYLTSTLSLRYKGPFSLSFNDYSYFLNDTFDRNPIPFSSQSCCVYCANSACRGPVSPSCLYGLRQSSLIQWSATRRLILGRRDHNCCCFPVQDVGQSCCCGHVCPLQEWNFRVSNNNGRGRWREDRLRCMVFEEKSERYRSSDFDDAEVMLSLLTEEVDEKCFDAIERKFGSSKRIKVKKRGGRDGAGGNLLEKKKKNVGSDLLESNSKCEIESVKINLKEEDKEKEHQKTECKGNYLKGEKRRARIKSGSSVSSYYSCSSLGNIESDTSVQAREEGYGEESAGMFERDVEEVTYPGEIVEEVNRHEDVSEAYGLEAKQERSRMQSFAASAGMENEWRKKSEKKLTEVSIEQTDLREKSSQKNNRLEVQETGRNQASRSQQQCDGMDKKSTFSVSIDEGTQQKTCQRTDQINEHVESRMKYKNFTGVQEIHNSDTEAIASSAKHFSRRHEKSSAAGTSVHETRHEHTETASNPGCMDAYTADYQQLNKVSKIEEIRGISTSQRQSEARVKKVDENSIAILNSAETKEQHFRIGKQDTRKKGSQDMSNASIIHSSDVSITDKERASEQMIRSQEERIKSQETCLTSVVKSTEEIEQHNLTDERITMVGSREEVQKPSNALSFSEGTSKEVFNFQTSQTSLTLNIQPTVQYIGVDLGDKGTSQTIMTPPTPQLVGRGPLHAEPTSDFATEGFPRTSLGGLHDEERNDETYEEPLNSIVQGNALASASQLQESSSRFVGEFIEKVTHEVSTPQVQKEKSSSGKESANEVSKHQNDSRRSSQSSGVKGPSDEIWDVMDTSTQEPAGTDAPESANPTNNIIAKRTGRSLWNVFSDVLHLRWGSRSESQKLTLKTGERRSPNQSSSEAWFSGHEPDELSDEHGKREKQSISQDSMSTDQLHVVTMPAGVHRDTSSLASSKDKIGYVRVDTSSSSASESEFVSKGFSSVSAKENSGRSGTLESAAKPSLQIRYPNVGEISEASKNSVSGSALLVHKDQPIGSGTTHLLGTESKDAVPKRGRLQRTHQVNRDKFDEWEEAYKLESEQRKIDEMFMREALLEARKAADMWEVPVGAVLVQHGKVIARGCNLVEELRDSTAHAEMICIRKASNLLHTWRLAETTLYITLEPCPMCAGAILQARIDAVVWGAPNKLLGADGSWIRLFPNGSEGGSGWELTEKSAAPVHPFHPNISVRRGVLATECADVMQQFFQLRRREKEKKEKPESSTSSPSPSCLPISRQPVKFFTKMHDAFHVMFCL